VNTVAVNFILLACLACCVKIGPTQFVSDVCLQLQGFLSLYLVGAACAQWKK